MLTLFFYPWNLWAKYKDVVVEAKKMVIPDRKVKPMEATFLCGRFLTVEKPPFLGDYALMKSDNLQSWGHAIMWSVGAIQHPGAITIQSELENIFGKPTVEMDPQVFDFAQTKQKNAELW